MGRVALARPILNAAAFKVCLLSDSHFENGCKQHTCTIP